MSLPVWFCCSNVVNTVHTDLICSILLEIRFQALHASRMHSAACAHTKHNIVRHFVRTCPEWCMSCLLAGARARAECGLPIATDSQQIHVRSHWHDLVMLILVMQHSDGFALIPYTSQWFALRHSAQPRRCKWVRIQTHDQCGGRNQFESDRCSRRVARYN